MKLQSRRHRWPFENELLVVGGCYYGVSAFPPAPSLPPASSPALDSRREKPTVSGITKRSIVVAGHKTSISLEDAFWKALREIARTQQTTLSNLVGSIDAGRDQHDNLSSAIRLFILDYYMSKCGDGQP